MLHHVDVHVRDLAASMRLFDALGELIGYERAEQEDWFACYRAHSGDRPRLLLTTEFEDAGGTMRLAFAVAERSSVDMAARVAAAHGARAVEAPQLNPKYGDDYYATFFEDADGNRYEILADAEAAAPPRIARIWRSRIRPGQIRDYRQYIAATGLSDYRATEGNRGAWMLTARRNDEYADVLTLSFWNSRESIARFAGEPIERAHYYPEDEHYLLERPETVEHFDLE